MNYQAALDYVWGLVNFETHPPETRAPYTLDRFRDFLSRLGNPEQAILAVHVAGSKGKGSTSAMIEAVLRAAGYRVGFYTSPHLHTPLERIRIGGQMIPEDEFAALVARLRPVAGSLDEVTTFEFLTALGFVYFAEQKVDVAVIEVGLGGRLDATNLVNPLVAVITPISLEHTKVLGATIEEIALEKAGIIKPGIPVVSAPQAQAARAVLLRTAAGRNAPIILVGQHWSWTRGAQSAEAQRFSVEFHPPGRPAASADEAALRREPGPDILLRYVDLAIPLLGLHQLDNATTAIAALELLKERGFPTSEPALRRGLASVEWPARVELLSWEPLVVADGAHNDASARALSQTLADLRNDGVVGWRKLSLIFGVLRDKNPAAVLAPLLSLADEIVLTAPQHPRALAAGETLEHLRASQLTLPPIRIIASVKEALDMVAAAAGPEDAILVTGSLATAAEGRQAWLSARLHPSL